MPRQVSVHHCAATPLVETNVTISETRGAVAAVCGMSRIFRSYELLIKLTSRSWISTGTVGTLPVLRQVEILSQTNTRSALR